MTFISKDFDDGTEIRTPFVKSISVSREERTMEVVTGSGSKYSLKFDEIHPEMKEILFEVRQQQLYSYSAAGQTSY